LSFGDGSPFLETVEHASNDGLVEDEVDLPDHFPSLCILVETNEVELEPELLHFLGLAFKQQDGLGLLGVLGVLGGENLIGSVLPDPDSFSQFVLAVEENLV
jgi:hypothetical protein